MMLKLGKANECRGAIALRNCLPFSVLISWAVTLDSDKATFHSTIFDIPMRLVREDQRHRRRFTR